MKKWFPIFLAGLALFPLAEAAKKPVPNGGFKSCKEALKYGYSHMREGQPGYSTKLDRDGDGVACDKVKK